ncbi:hypothetical protein [Phytohabitans houttuyneae]|uniref:Uncharacterized protein n=1 Tax=Phytohabitans houttuyneae TaxID=1076126 RepID=A0A6V8JYW0_9ACTN|nr:hypothetical protein [Phytohabitans houttuyneae]GFJ76464.1 hypothetical protein Phou_006440 [Phytohabitans houttuyneae]
MNAETRSTPNPVANQDSGCPACGSVSPTRNADGSCLTCQHWAQQFTTPGGLIINGNHYRIGDEPPGEAWARFPKGYGSYGVGFIIRRADGTEIITHNLWHQGEIPPNLARPDNAQIVTSGALVPDPPPSHRHANHLRYYRSSALAYRCMFDGCNCWFYTLDEAMQADARVYPASQTNHQRAVTYTRAKLIDLHRHYQHRLDDENADRQLLLEALLDKIGWLADHMDGREDA